MTLIEMVMSLLISSVLMLAIGSSVMIASRAVPTNARSYDSSAPAAEALDRLMSELMYAQSVTELSTTAVTFTVADRNSDTIPETIRWAWDGVVGHPLTRQYNGGNTATMVSGVQSLNLSHITTSKVVGSANIESTEQLLSSYNSATKLANQPINSSKAAGQYFNPTLPVGTTAWRVTRAKLMARSKGATVGQSTIKLCTASGGLPTTTTIDQATLLESTLTTGYTWQEFSFSAATGLTPGTGICLVVAWVSDADSCEIQYQNSSATDPQGNFVYSANGTNWQAYAANSLLYSVYGTFTSPTNVLQYNLQSVRASVTAGTSGSASVTSACEVLNHPQVTAP